LARGGWTHERRLVAGFVEAAALQLGAELLHPQPCRHFPLGSWCSRKVLEGWPPWGGGGGWVGRGKGMAASAEGERSWSFRLALDGFWGLGRRGFWWRVPSEGRGWESCWGRGWAARLVVGSAENVGQTSGKMKRILGVFFLFFGILLFPGCIQERFDW